MSSTTPGAPTAPTGTVHSCTEVRAATLAPSMSRGTKPRRARHQRSDRGGRHPGVLVGERCPATRLARRRTHSPSSTPATAVSRRSSGRSCAPESARRRRAGTDQRRRDARFRRESASLCAVGLSLDEAMTYAPLYVMQPGHSQYPWTGAVSWRTCRRFGGCSSAADGGDAQRQTPCAPNGRDTRRDPGRHRSWMAGVSRALGSRPPQRPDPRPLHRTAKPILDLIAACFRRRSPVHPESLRLQSPKDRTMIESVLRFAAVSRFVIADLSDPNRCWRTPAALPAFRSLPLVPVIETAQKEAKSSPSSRGTRQSRR